MRWSHRLESSVGRLIENDLHGATGNCQRIRYAPKDVRRHPDLLQVRRLQSIDAMGANTKRLAIRRRNCFQWIRRLTGPRPTSH